MVKTNTKKIKRKAAEEKSVSSTEELMTANDQVGLPENQEEGIVEKDGKNQKPADLDEKVLSLELKLAELNDKLLRAMAETENIRRRAHRDKEDSLKYGIRNFAEKMVVIADNIRRGIQSIDVEIRKKDSALEKVVIGFEMVERELLNSLSTFGVTPIDSIGQRFDPMFHEAMFEIENPNEVTGTIVQVLETGYKIHDRTLRAAKVGITKGGPKVDIETSKKTAENTEDNEPNIGKDHTAYEGKKEAPGGQVDEEL